MARRSLATVVETIRAIAPWAPIPLFAESYRVQQELILAVMTRHSITGCLTGCIRDFQRLWNIDYIELFSQSHLQRPPAVTSIRHGNVFDLANGALLEAAGLIGRRTAFTTVPKTSNMLRETIVNLTFITPSNPAVGPMSFNNTKSYVTMAFTLLEAASLLGVAILVAHQGLVIGAALLCCIFVSHVQAFSLRMLMDPIFGNLVAVESDRVQTARNGAALDVHIIADSWNSSKISVLCGYSSQLHALTNIPVRTTRPLFLKWLCRSLAVVLTTQAALLAAVANTDGDSRWSSLLWLGFYIAIALAKKGTHVVGSPEQVLEKQPASVCTMEPLHFTGRRAALVFISMLPVSTNVDRWAWWDVFMPDNDRRKAFHAELERSPAIKRATTWQEKGFATLAPESSNSNLSVLTSNFLEEGYEILENQAYKEAEEKYLTIVFPDTEALSTRLLV